MNFRVNQSKLNFPEEMSSSTAAEFIDQYQPLPQAPLDVDEASDQNTIQFNTLFKSVPTQRS